MIKIFNLVKELSTPQPYDCKGTTTFYFLQIFYKLLSKFIVNTLYRYFYGI